MRFDCVKDLRVHLSLSLISSSHCEAIASIANKTIGLIRRTFSTIFTSAKKLFYYFTLLQFRLTYCSQLWRPYLIKYIFILERVQRRATKYILNNFSSSYKTRLVQIDLLHLMYQYELIMIMIKILVNPWPAYQISTRLQLYTILYKIKSTIK